MEGTTAWEPTGVSAPASEPGPPPPSPPPLADAADAIDMEERLSWCLLCARARALAERAAASGVCQAARRLSRKPVARSRTLAVGFSCCAEEAVPGRSRAVLSSTEDGTPTGPNSVLCGQTEQG